ncbi:MAG: SDR family NAD(P)-dependent oxidoreductase [Paracoccaceae bacterium]
MSWAGIVITGASSGIGAALAVALARPGRQMLLVARDLGRLDRVAQAVRAHGAAAQVAPLDVTDGAAMADRLLAFDAERPVDLVLANAGRSSGRVGPGEGAISAGRTLAVNAMGPVNTVEPLLPAMASRRRGQIALMSSIAAFRPLPDMPSYGASKAAVRAYGTALRGGLRTHGLSVSVICPGFVASPMSARHRGLRPFEVPLDRAVAIILRGLERQQSEIAFPWPLVLLARIGAILPASWSDRAIERYPARIAPEPGPEHETRVAVGTANAQSQRPR